MNRLSSTRVVRSPRFTFVKLGVLMAFLTVQAASATLLVEHYPALIYPPFARDKGETGHIDVLAPEFVVEFEDSSAKPIPLTGLFAGIPSNLAIVLAKQVLLNSSNREQAILENMKPSFKKELILLRSRLRTKRDSLADGELSPELRAWLSQNILTHFGDGTPTGLVTRWWSQIYSTTQPPQLEERHLVDSVHCDLRSGT